MHSWRKTLVTGVVAGLLALPGVAGALPYTFVNIADTSGPFSIFGFAGGPALNNLGTVADHRRWVSGVDLTGLLSVVLLVWRLVCRSRRALL
jgi:hypothetical protein